MNKISQNFNSFRTEDRHEHQRRLIDFLFKYFLNSFIYFYEPFWLFVLFVRYKKDRLLCYYEESVTKPHLKIKQISIGFSWPGFLNEPLSLLFKFLSLKSHNNTQQLVLQSLHCHCVVHHHTATKVSRSVLRVWQLRVQVKTETGVIIHFFVS